MKKRCAILLAVFLATVSCKTELPQVAATPKPQDEATARMLMEELENKLSVPMTQDKYEGHVERMGRCPDRFDYLYEAAFAYCYAARQTDQKRRAIVQDKAEEYLQVWKDFLSKPETERNDFYTHVSDLIPWLISRYQDILRYDPNHPLKDDLLSAIRELQAHQRQERNQHNRTNGDNIQ